MGNKVFQDRISKLRNDSNLTMDQLAKKLNVSKRRENMWENNGTVPRNDVLKSLAEYFGVSIDYLLGNDSTENKEPESNELRVLQRGLKSLDQEELLKAKKVLSAVFDDIFSDDSED